MNYLETLKNIAKDKGKRVENLIFVLILLVILLFSFSYIFNSKEETVKTNEEAKDTTNKGNHRRNQMEE